MVIMVPGTSTGRPILGPMGNGTVLVLVVLVLVLLVPVPVPVPGTRLHIENREDQ